MDAAALTSLIMGILTPAVPLVGTAIATKIGEDAYEQTKERTKHLYEAIRKRFVHEKDGGNASQALQTFAGGDTDFSIVVEKKLFNLLQTDPSFATELLHIIQANGLRQSLTAAEEAKATHIRMNNTLGRGQQDINLGRGAIADDVQFNIGPEKPTP
jgi:hypothetical protein